ncbi:MAG: hypothetical protein JWP89_4218 [Schlesneria sp.]|nr:hypothetical protein [Schlesneria sp.]
MAVSLIEDTATPKTVSPWHPNQIWYPPRFNAKHDPYAKTDSAR